MLFNTDPQLVQEGSGILRILAMMLPLIGFQTVGASLFQAIGKGIPALLLSMARQILFLVPLILVLPLFIRLSGVWFAFPISDILATGVTAGFVAREIRQIETHTTS